VKESKKWSPPTLIVVSGDGSGGPLLPAANSTYAPNEGTFPGMASNKTLDATEGAITFVVYYGPGNNAGAS
jgi:hypothetical protein